MLTHNFETTEEALKYNVNSIPATKGFQGTKPRIIATHGQLKSKDIPAYTREDNNSKYKSLDASNLKCNTELGESKPYARYLERVL